MKNTGKSMPKPKLRLTKSDRELAERKWQGIVELASAIAREPNDSPRLKKLRQDYGRLLEEWQNLTGCKKTRRRG